RDALVELRARRRRLLEEVLLECGERASASRTIVRLGAAAEGVLELEDRACVAPRCGGEDLLRAARETGDELGLADARERHVEEEHGGWEPRVRKGGRGGLEDERPVRQPARGELALDALGERREIGPARAEAPECGRADAVHAELLERPRDRRREAGPPGDRGEVAERALGKEQMDGPRRDGGDREPARGHA